MGCHGGSGCRQSYRNYYGATKQSNTFAVNPDTMWYNHSNSKPNMNYETQSEARKDFERRYGIELTGDNMEEPKEVTPVIPPKVKAISKNKRK
jgi:hypothetical protein